MDKAYPELGDIGCAWAPETISDEQAAKMLVHSTIRVGKGGCNINCAYTDDAFTKLETKPEHVTGFVTHKNIGRFKEGVMKTTSFARPKHGVVWCLTLDELEAVAARWNVDIKLD